mmetsp:Transcript_23458/g.55694  ORF Transcript_23458/g.55694 Transcript_23458/m.55694 type:complete len:266 (-) Transcript_23458:639-1436(-)
MPDHPLLAQRQLEQVLERVLALEPSEQVLEQHLSSMSLAEGFAQAGAVQDGRRCRSTLHYPPRATCLGLPPEHRPPATTAHLQQHAGGTSAPRTRDPYRVHAARSALRSGCPCLTSPSRPGSPSAALRGKQAANTPPSSRRRLLRISSILTRHCGAAGCYPRKPPASPCQRPRRRHALPPWESVQCAAWRGSPKHRWPRQSRPNAWSTAFPGSRPGPALREGIEPTRLAPSTSHLQSGSRSSRSPPPQSRCSRHRSRCWSQSPAR